jgi:Tfp pilus assembly protein PilF
MKRAIIFPLIIILITGCAASFKEQRELSRPRVSLAMGKLHQDDIQGALIELRKAQKSNPDDPEVYYGFALAYWRSDKAEKALENVQKAIELGDRLGMEHPGLKSEAYNLRGIILNSMGSDEEAMKSFEAALKDELYLTPEYPLHNMASIYLANKQYDKAGEAANQALEYDPHYAPSWELLGRLFIEQGKDAHALEALKHAVLEFPGFIEAHWELAQLYLRLGNTDMGIVHLREVIRLDPESLLGAMAAQTLQSLPGASKKN